MNGTPQKNSQKTLLTGILIIFGLTLLSQASSIMNMILANSTSLSESVWIYILYTLRTLLDSFIYAAGAALLIHFTRVNNKKYRLISYLSAITVLFLDYGVSFAIDYALGHIIGYELLTLLYLLLNILIRVAMYALIILFSGNIYKNRGAGEMPIPFVSVSHPTSAMLNAAFILRITPYVLFEIYSNITGIIEYGFDMTAADVISIFSAYVEILIDGMIIYIVMYLTVIFFQRLDKNKESF